MVIRRMNESMRAVKRRTHILLLLLKDSSHCLLQRVIYHLHIINQSGMYLEIMTTCQPIQSIEQFSSVKYQSIHQVIIEEEVDQVAATRRN